MQVFISWSGSLSKRVSDHLQNWIQSVLQGVKVWTSYQDIDKGAMWFGDILNAFQNTDMGIICLTKDNLNAPWVLFEAGGLTKGLTKSRVCTFLVDVEHSDVRPPLSMFNGTLPNRQDVYDLVRSLNKHRAEDKLDEQILRKTFNHWWSEFEIEFGKILHQYRSDALQKQQRNPETVEALYTKIEELERQVSERAVAKQVTDVRPQLLQESAPEKVIPQPPQSARNAKKNRKKKTASPNSHGELFTDLN